MSVLFKTGSNDVSFISQQWCWSTIYQWIFWDSLLLWNYRLVNI